MKKLLFVVLGFAALSLTSCLDIFENITLNNDGSGTYEVKMDMAKGIKMMQDMMGGGASKKKKEKMDSSFSYKSIADTASALSAEEKKVFGKGTCHIKIDEEKAIAFVETKFPFANKDEFATLQNTMHKDNGGVNMFDAIDKIMSSKKGANDAMPPIGKKEKDDLPVGNLLYVLSDNSISCKTTNTLDKKKDEMDGMPKEFLEMMKMNMHLTINLAKPLTAIDNKTAVISSDKKVVTFSKELTLGESLKGIDFNFNINF